MNKITVISGAIIFRTVEEGLPSLIRELNHTAACRHTYAICGVRSGSLRCVRFGFFICGCNKDQFTFNCTDIPLFFLATDAFIWFSLELLKALLIEVRALCYELPCQYHL